MPDVAPPKPLTPKAEELAKAYGASEQTIEKLRGTTAHTVITDEVGLNKPLTPYEQPMVLGGINIRQDYEGRYCLNDLHKAAGGSPNTQPSNFLRNKQTQVLGDAFLKSDERVNRVTRQPIIVRQGGDNQGTFVEREFVYAYAMWINSEFYLKVIRAYDQLATKGIVVHEDHVEKFAADPMKMLEVIGEQFKKIMGNGMGY